jgi:3-hydroxybutyrate dehydrogenase
VTLNGFGNADEIEKIRSSLARDHKVEVHYSNADMRKPGQIAAMIAEASEKSGSLDILVNNAGIQFVSPVENFPDEKWEDIIAINLSSAFYTTRAVIPGMLEKGWGRIVNVASAHALVASPFKSAYVAAKHGLAGLTKTVALEVAENDITVNAIAPGYVETPLVLGQIADTAKARGISEEEVVRDVMLAAQPTKKMITIEQVADLAVFLCSESASGITGTILPIDGGWTAR